MDKDVSCSHCGAVHRLHSERLNWRDKDSLNCECCGELLYSWSEAKTWTATLIGKCGTSQTAAQS
jgi:hypothetical protein